MFLFVHELEDVFQDRDDAFVTGDVQWFPVESSPLFCQAPDAMVDFGRPKGRRGAYLQWRALGIDPET